MANWWFWPVMCHTGYGNIYKELGDKVQLEVREQKRLFGLFNVETKETYDLNQEGEIVKAKYNIWSRILNQERIRI